MWKIWLAIGAGGIVAIVTVLMGIINQARFAVILYRAVVSIALIGGGTFCMAVLGERFLLPYLLHQDVSLTNVDVAEKQKESRGDTEDQDIENEESLDQKQAEFSPFTAENLNRVSPPNS